jgi:hypothetical protein
VKARRSGWGIEACSNYQSNGGQNSVDALSDSWFHTAVSEKREDFAIAPLLHPQGHSIEIEELKVSNFAVVFAAIALKSTCAGFMCWLLGKITLAIEDANCRTDEPLHQP